LLNDTQVAIPFLFLTGHTERPVFEKAKAIQPYGFNVKPFNEEELIYTIELILNKHNGYIQYPSIQQRNG